MHDELYLSLLRQLDTSNHTILRLAVNGNLDVSDEGVVVLGVALSATERNILRQAEVFFQRDVSINTDCWLAHCRGKSLVCSINDNRLTRGKPLPLQLGDYVDIGLLRFKVVAADEASHMRQVSETSEHEETSFGLGRLADTQEWKATSGKNDPFDIVGVHVPYLDEVQSLDLPDPQIPSSPTHSKPLDEPNPEADVLSRLADEYAQVLLNPDLLHTHRWGETVIEPKNLPAYDPGAVHQNQVWKKDESLEDFILGKMTIKDILDRFKIDDSQKLEVTEPSEEVLSLFAQGVIPKRTERVHAGIRHDHQRINLDSYYQPGKSSDLENT